MGLEQFAKLNSEVRKWSAQTASMMKGKVDSLTNNTKHQYLRMNLVNRELYGSLTLAQSIKYKNNQKFGAVERIVFPFNKYGFFIAVGASRGHKAKENPRRKIDWYNFVFSQRFEGLADLVAENYADATINAMASLLDQKRL